jgi:hypothetical protein
MADRKIEASRRTPPQIRGTDHLVPTVLRGNAVFDALRRYFESRHVERKRTPSVPDGIPTGDRGNEVSLVVVLSEDRKKVS